MPSFDDVVAFGMDRRVVQRLIAVANPQKPRRLLEGLLAQLGYFLELRPAGKGAVFVTIRDNSFRQLGSDAGDIGQQRCTRRVDVNANRIDARFHFAIQRFA